MEIDLSSNQSLVSRVDAPVSAEISIVEVPFAGYRIRREGGSGLVQLVLSEGTDFARIEKAGVILGGLDKMGARGYIASSLLGLAGENSSAQAAGGVLCLMPCHWAMYASAIAKFTPVAAYFAAKPACCHADPDPARQVLAYALDAVFYGTLAGLGAGVVRRILRRRNAGRAGESLRSVLVENGELPGLQSASVWCPLFYKAIEGEGARSGIDELQKVISKKEYVRPASSLVGKAVQPIVRGVRNLAFSAKDKEYRSAKDGLADAFARLESVSRAVAGDLPEVERPYAVSLAAAYAHERAAASNPLTIGGLARKTVSYIKGFGDNVCWCKQEKS